MKKERIATLDAVRGVAILLIVAAHLWFQPPLKQFFPFAAEFGKFLMPQTTPNIGKLIPDVHSLKGLIITVVSAVSGLGHEGVHVFIVASGFGLTLSLLGNSECGAPRISVPWPQWWRKRLWRVAIPYWISLTGTFLLLMKWNLYFEFVPNTSAAAMLRQFFGLHALSVNYFNGINPPVWFMGLLFQLYLVFPILVWLFNSIGPGKLLALSMTVTLASRLLCFYYLKPFLSLSVVGCRLGEFVFGMYFAAWYKESRGRANSGGLVGAMMKLSAFLYLLGLAMHLSRVTAVFCDVVIGISLFLVLWRILDGAVNYIVRVFGLLGTYSLGIYLIHFPLFKPCLSLLGLLHVANPYVQFFMTLAICCIGGIAFEWTTGKVITFIRTPCQRRAR